MPICKFGLQLLQKHHVLTKKFDNRKHVSTTNATQNKSVKYTNIMEKQKACAAELKRCCFKSTNRRRRSKWAEQPGSWPIILPNCTFWNKFRWYPQQPQISFLQIFLKRAAKLSAGNPVEPVAPDLALCQRFPKPSPGPSLQPSPEPVEPDHQGFLEPFSGIPDLLWNLLRNPVEPDLALHQSLPEPSPEPSPEPNRALHRSLPHLLRNVLRNPVEPDLALHQSLPVPSSEPCWTWPGPSPKPVEPDLVLSPEPSPEPC